MSKESSLSPEAKSVLGAMVSRRGLLAGAGGLGAVGLLAACGGESETETSSAVRWGNWPLYLDYDEETKKYPTLEKFTAETGIAHKYLEDLR
jgi:spermidine/putrescine transport system substrate-binding protein